MSQIYVEQGYRNLIIEGKNKISRAYISCEIFINEALETE